MAAVAGIAILVSGPVLPACGSARPEIRINAPLTELPHPLPARSELPEGIRGEQEHLMEVTAPSNARYFSPAERESANRRLLAMLYNQRNQLSADTLVFIASTLQEPDARFYAMDRIRDDVSALSRVFNYSSHSDTQAAAIQRIRAIARESDYHDNNDTLVYIATYVEDRAANLCALARLRNDKDALRFVMAESEDERVVNRAERYLRRLTPDVNTDY